MDIIDRLVAHKQLFNMFPDAIILEDALSLNYSRPTQSVFNNERRVFSTCFTDDQLDITIDYSSSKNDSMKYFIDNLSSNNGNISSYRKNRNDIIVKINKNVIIDKDMYIALKGFYVESVEHEYSSNNIINHSVITGHCRDLFINSY